MVQIASTPPRTSRGDLDLESWLASLHARHPRIEIERVNACLLWLHAQYDELPMDGLQAQSLELADLLAELDMDTDAILAGLFYRTVRQQRLPRSEVRVQLGSGPWELVQAVVGMGATNLLEFSDAAWLEKAQVDQVENVKRMLVAMIDDVRVAVVKLAERTLALRSAKDDAPERRIRMAEEASQIFAPLAGRLGIFQIKWALEDLSLRYLHPEEYQSIASQLQGKRAQRESQVELMVDQVRALLRGSGIEAQVNGRAKNIYSIWRKMRTKDVSFAQVYDVRAVRVVVSRLADCYAALGLLHTTWEHIPREFDDYIANPKENGYQSLHTAVTVADGGALEIQIRTEEMHADAELGVCAHWTYKGDDDEDPRARDYRQKMDW
ncbi:MAG: HD domain-containing protein, partial [Pseudomonadota bacterium]